MAWKHQHEKDEGSWHWEHRRWEVRLRECLGGSTNWPESQRWDRHQTQGRHQTQDRDSWKGSAQGTDHRGHSRKFPKFELASSWDARRSRRTGDVAGSWEAHHCQEAELCPEEMPMGFMTWSRPQWFKVALVAAEKVTKAGGAGRLEPN